MSPIQQMLLGVGAVAKKTYVDNVFSTYLWKGDASATRSINTGLDMSTEGGLTWIKRRSNARNHAWYDTVRGAGKRIVSNSNSTWSQTFTDELKSFTSTGFTIGSSNNVNTNDETYASWSFRKAKGFFDVVTWTGDGDTGTGSDARSISHSLSAVPGMIIVKTYDEDGVDWAVYHRYLEPTAPYSYHLALNTSDARAAANIFGNKAPTSTHFYVSDNGGEQTNSNNKNYVAYLFAGGEDQTTSTACSIKIDAASDGLKIADSSDFDFGTGDFTMECFVNFTEKETGVLLGQSQNNWSLGTGLLLYMDAGDIKVYCKNNSSAWIFAGTQLGKTTPGQWHHVAITRSSNVFRFFFDGTQTYSATKTDYIMDVSDYFGIGWNSPLGGTHNCRISNVRVIKGQAVYTSSFKPSNVPLTTTSQGATASNVKLLCCQSSTVTTATVTPGTITKDGTVDASLDSPFDDPAGFAFGATGDQNLIRTGSYVGNGSTDGTEIYLGWEPSFLIVKNITDAEGWVMFDEMRGMHGGGDDKALFPNQDTVEQNRSSGQYWPTPTGFKLDGSSDGKVNGDGKTYIFVAIRRQDGYVGEPPDAGTDVFTMDYGVDASTAIPCFDSGFPVDMAMYKNPTSTGSFYLGTRLMGPKELATDGTGAESSFVHMTYDYNDGFRKTGSTSLLSWMWKRHAGFDVVCYQGNGINGRGIAHSMNDVPEMMIVKRKSSTEDWTVYHTGLTSINYHLTLNSESNQVDMSSTPEKVWKSAPTATHFEIGSHDRVNTDGEDYLALLFSSIEGISKVGSYSGNDSGQTITTGFQPRIIIIKQLAHNSWYLFDTVRGWSQDNQDWYLRLDLSSAQSDHVNDRPDDIGHPLSTGFYLKGDTNNDLVATNKTGSSYIYYCHA